MRLPDTLRPILVAVIGAALVSGCALTNKSEPVVPRYFSLNRNEATDTPRASTAPCSLELRLGAVEGASHIGELMVYRKATYELGFHRERRWAEGPEVYLRRRLARVLFEQRHLCQRVSGRGPSLEVTLLAFEEVRTPVPGSRIEVVARLRDETRVRWEETVRVDRPVTAAREPGADAVVQAFSEALDILVNRLATEVTERLGTPST